MKKYDSLVIDIFNIFYACTYANKKLEHKVKGKTLKTGGVYGSILYIRNKCNKYLKEGGKVYIASDNFSAKVNMRKEINPHYKANRDKKSKSFYKAIEYLLLILLNYSDDFIVIQKRGVEADDFIPALIDLHPIDKKILMISADLDWARSINYNGHHVDWYNGKHVFDSKKFATKYGFIPTDKSVILYKVFRGDRVDNIQVGLPNIRKEVLMQLLEYEDIYAVLDELPLIECLTSEWKTKLKENASRLILNHQMVSFIDIDTDDIQKYMQVCKFQPRFLKTLYKSLGFSKDFDLRIKKSVQAQMKTSNITEDDFFKQPEIPRV